MTNTTLLAPWLRRFLVEYLVTERNLSLNTQRSYRYTWRLLLPCLARSVKKSVDRLAVEDLSPERIKIFLADVEQTRHCGIATRNQRLAAIRSLAHFIGQNSPEHLQWCGQIRVVPFKKAPRSTITYLEKPEMDALLAAARGPRCNSSVTMLCFSFSITPELAPMRLPKSPSRILSWPTFQNGTTHPS